jgi:NAD(P)H-nitrite reductase large subunit
LSQLDANIMYIKYIYTPRIAHAISEGLDEEQVLEKIARIIKVYSAGAKKNELMGKYIERIGLDMFISQLEG